MARRDLTGALDPSVLETVCAGDAAIMDEVLGLFQQQAALWGPALDAGSDGWRDAVHSLKGTGRGVGAAALGLACEAAEAAPPDRLAAALDRVRDALDQALMDAAALRHEMMLRQLKG